MASGEDEITKVQDKIDAIDNKLVDIDAQISEAETKVNEAEEHSANLRGELVEVSENIKNEKKHLSKEELVGLLNDNCILLINLRLYFQIGSA